MSILLNAGSDPHREAWRLAYAVVLVVLVAALGVGFLTPIAALLSVPFYVLETVGLRVAPAEMVVSILQAIALSLLGPGSCSIDAYLFGRRVVVLPGKCNRDTG